MSTMGIRLLAAVSLGALLVWAQKVPPLLGKGWMAEFDHASHQLDALADATPAEKFAWRPAPGIRSVSEVYMHIAVGNYFILSQAGIAPPADVKISMETEKQVKEKADVIRWLKNS